MSTVVRPVTQIAETAVKSASTNRTGSRVLLAHGVDRIAARTRIRLVKTTIAKRAGDR
jgi:hypothetical protein